MKTQKQTINEMIAQIIAEARKAGLQRSYHLEKYHAQISDGCRLL